MRKAVGNQRIHLKHALFRSCLILMDLKWTWKFFPPPNLSTVLKKLFGVFLTHHSLFPIESYAGTNISNEGFWDREKALKN